ncbi:hypothetical protein KI387_021685, partial [Taxus chinensis]
GSECLNPRLSAAWTSEIQNWGISIWRNSGPELRKLQGVHGWTKLIGSALHFTDRIPVSTVNNEFLM